MLSRIHHLSGKLTPAERRVADWVQRHPQDIAPLTLAELASAASVSDPTVVRFCRSIGCRGYSDFKLRMTRYLATHSERPHAAVDINDTPATIADKVVGTSIRALQRVAQTLDTQTLETAGNAIANARRVMFAGVGASALVAADAHNKFFRLGLGSAAFHDEPTIRQAAATSDERSVFVAISKTGASQAVIDATQLARGNGANTIAITTPGSPLADAASLALLIDVDEDTTVYTPMSSRLAQLAVLDVLQVCTAMAGGPQALRYLEASKAALQGTVR